MDDRSPKCTLCRRWSPVRGGQCSVCRCLDSIRGTIADPDCLIEDYHWAQEVLTTLLGGLTVRVGNKPSPSEGGESRTKPATTPAKTENNQDTRAPLSRSPKAKSKEVVNPRLEDSHQIQIADFEVGSPEDKERSKQRYLEDLAKHKDREKQKESRHSARSRSPIEPKESSQASSWKPSLRSRPQTITAEPVSLKPVSPKHSPRLHHSPPGHRDGRDPESEEDKRPALPRRRQSFCDKRSQQVSKGRGKGKVWRIKASPNAESAAGPVFDRKVEGFSGQKKKKKNKGVKRAEWHAAKRGWGPPLTKQARGKLDQEEEEVEEEESLAELSEQPRDKDNIDPEAVINERIRNWGDASEEAGTGSS